LYDLLATQYVRAVSRASMASRSVGAPSARIVGELSAGISASGVGACGELITYMCEGVTAPLLRYVLRCPAAAMPVPLRKSVHACTCVCAIMAVDMTSGQTTAGVYVYGAHAEAGLAASGKGSRLGVGHKG